MARDLSPCFCRRVEKRGQTRLKRFCGVCPKKVCKQKARFAYKLSVEDGANEANGADGASWANGAYRLMESMGLLGLMGLIG